MSFGIKCDWNMAYFHFVLLVVFLLLGTLQHCQGANVTAIRLADRALNGRFGRLEIQVNGEDVWGVVCDDGWPSNEANAIVACRQLGFGNGGKAVLDNTYGRGTGNFLLDDTDCAADMTSLAQCSSAQQDDCGPSDQAVGLECNAVAGNDVTTFSPPEETSVETSELGDNCNDPANSPTVRLFRKAGVNGTGFVRVLNPTTNTWGFVCDDGWNSNAAKVVCAQLCYPTDYTAKPGIPAEHRVFPTSPNIILDEVRCIGTENTLQACSHNNFAATNDCSAENGELAGVQCIEATFNPPEPPDPVLECGEGFLKASFHRSRDRNLEEKHLSVWDDPTCADVEKATTTEFVSINIPVDKCGTNLTRNGTHIIYENEIKYASTSVDGAITRSNTYKVAITCALPVAKTVTQRVQPEIESVTKKADGIITASMALYRSDSFQNAITENPVRIPLGQYLYMSVNMEKYDSRLKIVVTDCLSTPTGDTSNARLTKELYVDKCSVESTLSTYPLSNSEFAFRFKPFKFVNYPLLYIQCNAIVCRTADVTEECDRSCNNTKPDAGRRKKRSVVQRQAVQSPAIQIYDLHAPDENNGHEKEIVIDVDNSDSTTKKWTYVQTSTPKVVTTLLTTVKQKFPIPLSTFETNTTQGLSLTLDEIVEKGTDDDNNDNDENDQSSDNKLQGSLAPRLSAVWKILILLPLLLPLLS